MKKSKHKEMTILEASDYFNEHDIFEFKNVREVTDMKLKCRKRNMSGSTWNFSERSKSKAKKLHKSEDLLIKEWLMEKVR